MQATFISILHEYMNRDITDNTYAVRTVRNKKSFIRGICKFLFNKNITVHDVDHALMEDLYTHMRGKGISMNNAARSVDICKKAMTYAHRRKLVLFNPIIDYAPNRGYLKEVICCEPNELQKMIYAETQDLADRIMNDLYIAQAVTGMSYGDLRTYKIVKDEVATWLVNKRNKTGREYWVPLDKIEYGHVFLDIHNRYNGNLPIPKNMEYNLFIRANATKLGIDKYLTSHTARKTFATRMFNDGWEMEDIAVMMGITIQVLKHYIKFSRRRLDQTIKNRSELGRAPQKNLLLQAV